MKACTKCGALKDETAFFKRGDNSSKLTAHCRACTIKRTSAYQKQHPEVARKAHAKYMQKYGRANPEKVKGANLRRYWPHLCAKDALKTYRLLFEQQEGKCKICKCHQSTLKHALCVDHQHTAPFKIRGLLCHTCNRGIGLLKDSPEILNEAVAYLKAV